MSRARSGRTLWAVAVAAASLTLFPAAANAAFGDRALERGDTGHDVRVLQSWLTELGFRTPVDGHFGKGTERSLQRYERRNRLEPNGELSREESRRMRRQVERAERSERREEPPANGDYDFGERTLARGAHGHDVRVLQSWLTRLGINTQVDGAFGAGTERNVEQYDRQNGLTVDGEVSRGQARRMRRQIEEGARTPAPEPQTQEVSGDHVFPVQGPHRYGDGFGADRGGRSHQGGDVFADCGTPLVAAQGGRVEYAGFHSAAGNYVVITGAESGEDYVYMHLRAASPVSTGDSVATGQRIGEVGETGNASGCHLHFELWSAPGWYKGGAAYDPMPALRSWDRSEAQPASAAASSAG